MRTVFLFFLFGFSLIALTAVVKGKEEESACRYAYNVAKFHKQNGMQYDDHAFTDIQLKRAYAFGWMYDTR
jgi:hypothetical protein